MPTRFGAMPTGGPGFAGTRAVRASSAQTVPDTTLTRMVYDSTTFDDDDWWEGVTNPERITVDLAGRYLVQVQFLFVNHTTGFRYGVLRRYNSADAAQETLGEFVRETDITNPYGFITGVSEASADDYYVLDCQQTSGGNLNTIAAKLHLTVQRVP